MHKKIAALRCPTTILDLYLASLWLLQQRREKTNQLQCKVWLHLAFVGLIRLAICIFWLEMFWSVTDFKKHMEGCCDPSPRNHVLIFTTPTPRESLWIMGIAMEVLSRPWAQSWALSPKGPWRLPVSIPLSHPTHVSCHDGLTEETKSRRIAAK